MFEAHTSAVVDDPNLRVAMVGRPTWQTNRNRRRHGSRCCRQKIVKGVINQLGEALPGRKLNVAKNRKQSRVWRDINTLPTDRNLLVNHGTFPPLAC
ncbi:Uncharacterised protein [Mycobacteroides abscessus subsp. bolletii]|nr:Uncharacterised protein [Mycobacteroides abscessus subsp. bolletii]SIJ69052.1 Uncharacterised protein [Mycobacteroides abscessus subsp. bolletii]SKT28423.1 Uncharacterised protein [Mycobacteroides abscessus subsp. bolletii]SKT32933.1 Uncharacterised protein [Mycobacteroides abscessus subsp. bolletii]SLD66076.1 Uncharacterised protein [Mycobacteroides abscessus subsp. bolletii]